jgi:hypothetical protein
MDYPATEIELDGFEYDESDPFVHDWLLDEAYEANRGLPPIMEGATDEITGLGSLSERASFYRAKERLARDLHRRPANAREVLAVVQADADQGRVDDVRDLVVAEQLWERDPSFWREIRDARDAGDRRMMAKLTRRSLGVHHQGTHRLRSARPRCRIRARRAHGRPRRAAGAKSGADPGDPGGEPPEPAPLSWLGRFGLADLVGARP